MAGVEEETAACDAGKSSSSGEKKMFVLKASDGELYEVEEAVAKMSHTLSPLIEDALIDNAIPLPNVTGKILGKVLDYCKKHTEEEAVVGLSEEDDMSPKRAMEKWDADYVDVDRETLIEIILAADYLDIKGLFGLTCQRFADLIKDMWVEEVREVFHIENDYTEEEEAKVRNEMNTLGCLKREFDDNEQGV